MLQTVKGIYRNGKVELLESPSGITEGEVIVTFVESPVLVNPKPVDKPSRMITFGMFADGARKSTDEDFKAAEFHGDDDDGLDWS
jgi:hypothetical protein